MDNTYPVIGIDVAKDFCFYCAVSPTGKTFLKPFKALNTKEGLDFVLKEIKKVEKAFNQKPAIVLESTGHYSHRLVHFFSKNEFKVFLVNPLQSHSIKNSSIRKVKTDKVDAQDLAKLFFLKDLREYELSHENLENLKILSRTAAQLSEQRVMIINQLVAAIDQVLPGFTKIFDNVSSKTALGILINYASPAELLTAPKSDLIHIMQSCSRRSLEYVTDKYTLLMQCARDAVDTGISLSAYYEILRIYALNLRHMNDQIAILDEKIKDLSINVHEVSLLKSIPGIGEKLAPIIAGEIGDITRFNTAKQLVAYCGIDPSVRQSGNFTGTSNKFTKRGSVFLRKALYIAAIVSVKKGVNPVIYEYYQEKIKSKIKKQALGAIMNKLVRIIFSVLKNNREFVLITPEEQVKMYRSNLKAVA